MQATESGTTRARRGEASLFVKNDRIYVRFPREVFAGSLVKRSLGLRTTKQGWEEANRKLRLIQNDIDLGEFDVTLERYLPPYEKEGYLKKVQELRPDTSLLSLWTQYLNYKRHQWKETTYLYVDGLTGYLKRCNVTSPYKALELREWLLENTTESQAKRVITHVNAAFNWGLKHKVVKGKNPYTGMAQELKHRYERETKPIAFNKKEKEMILKAFAGHKGNWDGKSWVGNKYSYYLPLVEFLFYTGCRPSEAIGLQWKQISKDFRTITFNGGVTYTKGKNIRTEGSKNNKSRKFPCNNELQQFLKSIKPDKAKPDDLVFSSPRGKEIHYGNFQRRAWHTLVDPIKPNTTPYSCRDTFITEQIRNNIPPAVIAKWLDTSVAIIEKHYFDSDSITAILPNYE